MLQLSRGLNVYVPERKLNDFSDYNVSGSIESALDECDLVIDAAPGGHGYKNKKNYMNPKIFLPFTKVENLLLAMKLFLIYYLILVQIMIMHWVKNM